MAAELEAQLDESSRLFVSSGGVFEVQYDGKLVFSKKATGRFPEDGEVVRIIYGLDQGLDLVEAQKQASAGISPPPTFTQWLTDFVKRRR